MVDSITIGKLMEKHKDRFTDSLIILSNLLNVDKSYLYTHIDRRLEEDIVKEFEYMMSKLDEDYPIQYLVGEKDFMSMKIYLEEGVLIPRNDTEILVEFIIEDVKDSNKKILEIGYGSGAISLSIAKNCKNTNITGIDISKKAFEVANKNREIHKLDNVNFLKGDLFSPLKDENFDIIVSNPPYIDSEAMNKLDKNVKDYEPSLALYGGEDGLDFYREITKNSIKFLKKDGMLIYEIGYDQKKSVTDILKEHGFKNISCIKDLQGHDRVVLGYR